jgi:hypothetical protein
VRPLKHLAVDAGLTLPALHARARRRGMTLAKRPGLYGPVTLVTPEEEAALEKRSPWHDRDALPERAERALRIAEGPMSVSEVAAVAGVSPYRIGITLAYLVKRGRLARVRPGVYVLNPERRAA